MPMEEADGGGVTAPKAASLVWGMPVGRPANHTLLSHMPKIDETEK